MRMHASLTHSWKLTRSVWNALFLREAVARLSTGRAAWFWVLAEPVFHISYLVYLYSVVQVRHIGGIHTALWVATGLLTYFMFSRTANQASNALSANQALFTYRQVKPVDTVIVRALLEAFLMFFVIVAILMTLSLFDVDSFPKDIALVMQALFGMWILGFGFGLVTSVAGKLVDEFAKIMRFIMMPMYMISGVIFPVALVPQPHRGWLMWNPVAHGLEAVRLGFAPYYHVAPEVSMAYLYGFAISLLFAGLVLHRRFAERLVTE